MPDSRRAPLLRRVPSLLSETTYAVLSFGRCCLENRRGLRLRDQIAVACLVLSRHPEGGEALLEPGADCSSVKTRQLADGSDSFFLPIYDEAGYPVLDHLGHGA